MSKTIEEINAEISDIKKNANVNSSAYLLGNVLADIFQWAQEAAQENTTAETQTEN